MLRIVVSLLAITAFPSAIMAEPAIPSWCCPDTCRVAQNARRVDSASGEKAVVLDDRRIPLSENVFRGSAPDGQTRFCIGFDAFGDPEVKCLFSPLPLT